MLPHAAAIAVRLDQLQVRQLPPTAGHARRLHKHPAHTTERANTNINAPQHRTLPLQVRARHKKQARPGREHRTGYLLNCPRGVGEPGEEIQSGDPENIRAAARYARWLCQAYGAMPVGDTV